MKNFKFFALAALAASALCSCGNNSDPAKTIVVGASPSPHSEILSSDAVQNYVKSKGYTLEVKVYQDYVTPNQALNSGAIDANYFQHIPYLEGQIKDYNYDITAVAAVHNEPLNLYGPEGTNVSTIAQARDFFKDKTISIINDQSNVERAYKLLQTWEIIDTYDVTNFDAKHLVYTSSIGVTLESFDGGLLHTKVEQGGFAVINGNYALTAWKSNPELATKYRVLGETEDVAYPNIIATKTADKNSDKTNVLVEALSQTAVREFISKKYGATVNYCFNDLRK